MDMAMVTTMERDLLKPSQDMDIMAMDMVWAMVMDMAMVTIMASVLLSQLLLLSQLPLLSRLLLLNLQPLLSLDMDTMVVDMAMDTMIWLWTPWILRQEIC